MQFLPPLPHRDLRVHDRSPGTFRGYQNVMKIEVAPHRLSPPPITLVPFLPVGTRLDVIQSMLGDLETATTAGRHYVMAKMLTQLREAASAAESSLSDLQRRAARNTLVQLAREDEKLLPDAEAFARGARSLAAALSRA
jgi:hypothetical protein